MRALKNILSVVGAGALAGAMIGVLESGLLTVSSGGHFEEFWIVLFAVLAYGGLGALLGTGAAVVWQMVRWGGADAGQLSAVSVAIGAALPGFAVGRYHVAKRVFEEKFQLMSAGGLAATALILLGALVAAALGVIIVRACRRRAGGFGPAIGFLALAGIALLIGIGAGPSQAPAVVRRPRPPEAQGRPNIILVIADTLRADSVDWMAGGSGRDGGLTALAADGVVFDGAYSQSSWTRPSVASILTSLYPSTHGAVHKMDFLSDRVLTLAEALRDHGYWTAAVTTNINVAPVFNLNQGFEEFWYLEPSFYFSASDSATGLAIYKGLRVAREKLLSSRMYFEHYYQDAKVVNRHLFGWFAENPPEPFFLLIHYMDPHDPYFEIPYNGRGVARVTNPSPPAADAARLRDLYRQDVAYLEVELAELMKRLRENGVYERSIIAFTADHGEEFYEHEGWWHGTTLYEEAVHVPLMIKESTNGTMRGSRRSDLVRTIDIAPTLMAAAGLAIPEPFLGVDLFSAQVDEPLFAEEDLEGNSLASLREGPWKLILANRENPRGLPEVELFNLEADPAESRNLAAIEPSRVEEMRLKLEEMRLRVSGESATRKRAASDAVDRRS